MADGSRAAEPRSRPWRVPPLLIASAALHAGGLACLAFAPASVRTVVPLFVANHALLTGIGLWPRSRSYGPNLVRSESEGSRERPGMALTFDDGPDPEVTPAVLDLLDRHGARASFFCVGERAARHPKLVRAIAERGHRVENHTHTHPWHFSMLGPRGMAREIDRAQETIEDATGRRPRLFRPPAGFRNALLEPVLARRGLWLTSWTRRGFDTVERNPASVLRRLSGGAAGAVEPGEILLMHDARAASEWRFTGDRRPLVLAVLPELLRRLDRAGLRSVPVEPPGDGDAGTEKGRRARIGVGSTGP